MVDAGFSCPNRDGTKGAGGCIYCDNAAFSPLLKGGIKEQALQQIERMKRPPGAVVVYFQPFSNTYGAPERLRKVYAEALAVPGVRAIAVGTRPDCVDGGVFNVLEELAGSVDVFLELGVQSANDVTLKRINRGHGWAETEAAFKLAAAHKRIFTAAHLIIGLPGEGREDALRTARMTAELRPHGIKLHHLHVVRNTPLEKEYREGRVKVLSEAEYTALAVDTIHAFPPDTVLHRLMGETLGEALVTPVWKRSKQEIASEILMRVRR